VKRVVTKEGSKQVGSFLGIGLYSLFVSPFMSQDAYNKRLEKQLEKVSQITISASISELVEFIKITKKSHKRFKDSDAETEEIVKVIPTLRPFYKEVYQRVKKCRTKIFLK
jgi:nitric oxide reductase large subunit